VQDGWLDIAVVSEFPTVIAAGLALRLFTKTIDEMVHMNMLRAKELTLTREEEGIMQIDGTPVMMPATLHVKIVEDGLKVLVKKRF
jgi:diacylglycerol kinase family enzyme